MDKVRTLTRRARHRTLADLLRRLNPVLRGWCNYFRHGVSKRDLQLPRPLRLLAGRRLAPQTTPRAELGTPWSAATSPVGRSATAASRCSGPQAVAINRYRYRGTTHPDTMVEPTDDTAA